MQPCITGWGHTKFGALKEQSLEDLIIAAFNDAKGKSEAEAQRKMAEVTAGLPIPPGMKLPF